MSCIFHPSPNKKNTCSFMYNNIFGDIHVDIDTFEVCGLFYFCVDLLDLMTRKTIHIDGETFESLVFQLNDLISPNISRVSTVCDDRISVKQIPLSDLYKITCFAGDTLTFDMNIVRGLFDIYGKLKDVALRKNMGLYRCDYED